MTQTPRFIDTLRGGSAGLSDAAGFGSPEERRAADGNDARRFEDLMRGDAGGEEPGGGEGGEPAPDGAPLPPGPFALFRPAAGGQEAAAPPAPSAAGLAELAEAVAERILVSEEGGADAEVRIRIRDGVMPGVEVRLKWAEGRVQVEFACANADSRTFLEGRREALADLLAERTGEEVEVRVSADDGTGGQPGGKPGDGRSRGQYLPPGDSAEESA